MMCKDPAFLFYSADFYMGTIGMSNAQVGAYIRLLCLQHQQGHLDINAIKDVIGGEDGKILSKFIVDENGRYYNQRLSDEIEKRNRYSVSRSQNRMSKVSTTHDEHMSNICQSYVRHMENENINKNISIKPIKHKYGEYNNVLLTDADLEKLKAEYPDEWESLIERLSGYMASKGVTYKNHLATIRNWKRKDKESAPQSAPDYSRDYSGGENIFRGGKMG